MSSTLLNRATEAMVAAAPGVATTRKYRLRPRMSTLNRATAPLSPDWAPAPAEVTAIPETSAKFALASSPSRTFRTLAYELVDPVKVEKTTSMLVVTAQRVNVRECVALDATATPLLHWT